MVAMYGLGYYILWFFVDTMHLLNFEWSFLYIFNLSIISLLATAVYLYFIFVFAYLLGMLAPMDER